ncbi:MAG: CoA transferase [Gammaproteobacteria bacterium]|nr:CoA transferase [Gammaproteobacteria bacterium]
MASAANTPQGPLVGLKVLELAGIGPAPLASTLLSDMGANVLRVDRNVPSGLGSPRGNTKTDILRRGRMSVSVDLKHPEGVETVLALVEKADALIDPFRPGVTERLGLGPDECLARNAKLLYARMTGWGQDGPLSQAAGHDLNYLSLTGVTHSIGPKELPTPPLNVVADMGGGAMFLAFGILAGIYETQRSGKGQVVDVSMVEGSAFLAMGLYGARASGSWVDERASNVLDGGAPYYRCYATADAKFVSVAAIETKFYAILLDKLGLAEAKDLPAQTDRERWPELAERFAAIFVQKTRDEWCEIMEGTDICFAPVLTVPEAFEHPHNTERQSFIDVAGVKQPGPAPRFSRTPGLVRSPPPEYGADTDAGLLDWGMSSGEVERLNSNGVVGWKG